MAVQVCFFSWCLPSGSQPGWRKRRIPPAAKQAQPAPAPAGGDQKAPADEGGAKKEPPPAWSAVAGAVWWEDFIDDPRIVFATAEQFGEKDAAEKNAVRMCKAAGGGDDCEVIVSVAKDCVYYAVGFTGKDDVEFHSYTADSEQGVADVCKAAGADCGEGTHKLCAAAPGYTSSPSASSRFR